MEGYLNFRIAPWIRRLITRLLAIIPALIVIYYFGESATGKLLILSQVILSLQLGFAIVPLIHFVSDKHTMKEFTIKIYMKIIAWTIALIIVGLNARLVFSQIKEWIKITDNPILLLFFVLPLVIGAAVLLLYITFRPLFHKAIKTVAIKPHGGFHPLQTIEVKPYKRIAVALDFSEIDQHNISNALAQGGKHAEYLLIHVVESAGALVMRNDIRDYEFHSDQKYLHQYAEELMLTGYKIETKIGYGNPKKAIPQLVSELNADLLIMGAHGHRGFKDLLFGTTVDAVRHRVKIPVLIVRKN